MADDGGGKGETPRERRFLGRLSVNEWLTLLVGFGTLLVSLLTYLNATDTSDIKQAVRGLTTLASETHRQANETKRQADALSAQLELLKTQSLESKRQTKAISEQTSAIKSSAVAAVKSAGAEIESAQAQTRAAMEAAAAQRPGVALGAMTLTGFDGAPEKDGPMKGSIKLTFNYQFKNVGGSPWKLIDNAQTVTFTNNLPLIPDYSHAQHFLGGGLVIAKGEYTFLTGTPYVFISPKDAENIKNHTVNVFVYGIFTYDVFGTDHKFCYAYELPIVGDAAVRYIEAGTPAYHCDT